MMFHLAEQEKHFNDQNMYSYADFQITIFYLWIMPGVVFSHEVVLARPEIRVQWLRVTRAALRGWWR